MKRVFVMLMVVGLSLSSCDFSDWPYGDSIFAPSPEELYVQEDPGTGLYGYLNEYGLWVIEPKYRYAGEFDEDMGWAVVSVYGNYYGAIDTRERTVIQFRFTTSYDVQSAIRSIEKGRYRGIDLWPEEDGGTGLYGYLDYYGEWFIEPQYLAAGEMYDEGVAVVQFLDEMWGAIDRYNKVVVAPNFTTSFDAKQALRTLLDRL